MVTKENLDELTKNLKQLQAVQDPTAENSLRQQTSATSLGADSGIDSSVASKKPSSSSIGWPDLYLHEKNPTDHLSSVKITIEGESLEESTEHELATKNLASGSDSSRHLGISNLSRKNSDASSNSDDYITAPSSPVLKISRDLPIQTSSSSSDVAQEVRVSVDINFPASNEKFTVHTTAMIHNKLKQQLQLIFFLSPASARSPHGHRPRSYSSPSSTPSSPNLPKKKRLHVPTKYYENSPEMLHPIIDHDTSRRERNELIARIVKRNMVEFVNSTDFDSLSTHLYGVDLLSHKDMDDLAGIKGNRGKNCYFYMLLLDTKGQDAYQKLFDCLKSENEHCGHKDLVHIIELN